MFKALEIVITHLAQVDGLDWAAVGAGVFVGRLVAVVLGVPLADQTKPGVDPDALVGRVTVTVRDADAVIGEVVGSYFPGARGKLPEVWLLGFPPEHRAEGRHVVIVADAGERLTVGEAFADALGDVVGVGGRATDRPLVGFIGQGWLLGSLISSDIAVYLAHGKTAV